MLIIGICDYKKFDVCILLSVTRFKVVETSPVNEELQTNISELFMQHFTQETCIGKKKSNNQEFLPTTFICGTFVAAIHFLYLALERGRQSTRSSPGKFVCKKLPENWLWVAAIFVETRERPGRLKDREGHGIGHKCEKSVSGTRMFIGMFPPRKRNYLFRNSVYSGKFPEERTKKSCSIYISTGIYGIFW